jgi:hypothetical protein
VRVCVICLPGLGQALAVLAEVCTISSQLNPPEESEEKQAENTSNDSASKLQSLGCSTSSTCLSERA